MRHASCTRSMRARILGFSFFNQDWSICWAIARSTLLSIRFAPFGVPRSDGEELRLGVSLEIGGSNETQWSD